MIEIIIGALAGIISGTGMGGGTILILVLSIFLGINQHIAQATNIVFFIPTAIAAILVSIKSKLIEWKTGITIALSGIVGAIIRISYIIKDKCYYIKKTVWIVFSAYCDT